MKRTIQVCVAVLAITAVAAAGAVKLTFLNVTFSDGTVGTIQAGVKTTGKGVQVTVCDYYFEPDDQFVGEFQANTNINPVTADAVGQFCTDHFDDRQPAK